MEESEVIGSLDQYIIKKIISNEGEKGNFSIVFLVEDKAKKGKEYVAKVNSDENYEIYIKNEWKILNQLNVLNSPYIISFFEYNNKGKLLLRDQLFFKKYLILEYCKPGILSDYIFLINEMDKSEGFQEQPFAKYIFKQIVEGVKVIHNNKIVHYHLRLSNIILDNDYNIKIFDFGGSFSQKQKYIKKNNLFKLTNDNPLYNSPQFCDDYSKKINGYKNDIFCLGILLFTLVTGKHPFINYDDFKMKSKNINGFLEEKRKEFHFSPEFEDLFKHMILINEDDRFSIENVDNHIWLNEINHLNPNQLAQIKNNLIIELQRRKTIIDSLKNSTKEINMIIIIIINLLTDQLMIIK